MIKVKHLLVGLCLSLFVLAGCAPGSYETEFEFVYDFGQDAVQFFRVDKSKFTLTKGPDIPYDRIVFFF